MIGNLAHEYCNLLHQLVALLGMSRPLAHVHAGLLIYVIVQVSSRDRRASATALQWVIGLAVAHEVVEAIAWQSPRWGDTFGDLALTLMWPAVLFTVGRHRRRRWMALQAKIDANPIYSLRPTPA
jgi:hypothetical protein